MNDSIRIRLTLSYQGETHDLSALVDLDQCAAMPDERPNFHLLLARANGIDPYSYLYEALEAHEIEFTEPTGLAVRSCRGGAFDWNQFVADQREEGELTQLRAIAARTMGIAELDEQPALKAALWAAYRAGKGG